jgi:hypothetical protein
MLTAFCFLLLAVLVFYALYRYRSVLFQFQFLGARVHLEAKDRND